MKFVNHFILVGNTDPQWRWNRILLLTLGSHSATEAAHPYSGKEWNDNLLITLLVRKCGITFLTRLELEMEFLIQDEDVRTEADIKTFKNTCSYVFRKGFVTQSDSCYAYLSRLHFTSVQSLNKKGRCSTVLWLVMMRNSCGIAESANHCLRNALKKEDTWKRRQMRNHHINFEILTASFMAGRMVTLITNYNPASQLPHLPLPTPKRGWRIGFEKNRLRITVANHVTSPHARAERSLSTNRYPGSVFIISVKPHVHHRFPIPKDLCIYTASSCSFLYRAHLERLARPRRSTPQTDKVSLSPRHAGRCQCNEAASLLCSVRSALFGWPQCRPRSPPTEETVLPLFHCFLQDN